VADRRGLHRAARAAAPAGAGRARRRGPPDPPRSVVAAGGHLRRRDLRRLLRGRGRRDAAGAVTCCRPARAGDGQRPAQRGPARART
jgi:hypothetical protein